MKAKTVLIIIVIVVAFAGICTWAYFYGESAKVERIKEEFGTISISDSEIKEGMQGIIPDYAKIGSEVE